MARQQRERSFGGIRKLCLQMTSNNFLNTLEINQETKLREDLIFVIVLCPADLCNGI